MDASTKNALDVNIKKHNITVPTQDTNKVISEILSGMQTWLDTKSHIPLELKQKFLELGSNNLEEFIESAFNKFNNKWIVKEFIDNAFVPPREESNKYLADSGCDSAEQLWTKMENLRISDDSNKATTSQASSESINSSDFKGNKKEFVNMVLKRVNPDIAELVEKEIVLKLVYDVQKGLITKRDAGKIIYSFNDDFDLSDGWLANNNLSIDEIKAKEVEITGGASYLE